MPEVKQNVQLLSFTPEVEKLTAIAAKLCYNPSGIEDIPEGITDESASAFIEKMAQDSELFRSVAEVCERLQKRILVYHTVGYTRSRNLDSRKV